MIKTLKELAIKERYLNAIKTIYDESTHNIMFYGEKFEAFFLRSGKRQRYPFSPFLFYSLLECLATAVRQEREIKGI